MDKSNDSPPACVPPEDPHKGGAFGAAAPSFGGSRVPLFAARQVLNEATVGSYDRK